MSDDTINSKLIPTINADGDRVLLRHQMPNRVKTQWYSSLHASGLGFYILFPLMSMLAAGIFLDSRYGTKPRFVLVFIFVGMLFALYNLYRLLKK